MLDQGLLTPYPVLPLLRARWSPRRFSGQSVEGEKLQSMFAAARLAPSAHNTQPWRFILTRKERPEAFGRALDCLYPANQIWARTAPVLILAATAVERFSHRDCTYVAYGHRHHDLGMAVMSFILQGQALGVHSHPIAGFDEARAASAFEIPAAFEPFVMLAVGYPDDSESAVEPGPASEPSPRTRRPLPEIVFEDRWLQPTSLFVACSLH